MKNKIRLGGVFSVDCFGRDGEFKWHSVAENLVPNAALQKILGLIFAGSSTVATWYIGLTDSDPTVAAGDTMDSHGGWTEVTAYDEATRQEFVDVRSDQSVGNSASKAAFTMSSTSTVGGIFLASSSVKGGQTATVVLLCGAAFTEGDRAVIDGDTINAQYTFSAADDGA